jgi:anti-sigma B factor antagonist
VPGRNDVTAIDSAPVRLQIGEQVRGDDTVLELTGELDIATAGDLVDAARRALRRRPVRLVVDLHDIAFLDLTGARARIRCRRLATAKDSGFQLAQPSVAVTRMFDVSGLHAVFDIQRDAHHERPATQEA